MLLLTAAIVALLFLFPILSGFLTDWWWFQEIGYQVVFTRELATRLLLFLAAGGPTAGVLYLNLAVAQRGIVPHPIVLQLGEGVPNVNLPAMLKRLILPVSLVVGLLCRTRRRARLEHGAPGDLRNAVRHQGSGLFPRHRLLRLHPARPLRAARLPDRPHHDLAGAAACRSTGCAATSSSAPAARASASSPRRGCTSPSWRRSGFLLTAVRLWLVDIPSLLYSTTGPLVGASYTDLHATLPALRVTAVLAALAAVPFLVGGCAGSWAATGSGP